MSKPLVPAGNSEAANPFTNNQIWPYATAGQGVRAAHEEKGEQELDSLKNKCAQE